MCTIMLSGVTSLQVCVPLCGDWRHPSLVRSCVLVCVCVCVFACGSVNSVCLFVGLHHVCEYYRVTWSHISECVLCVLTGVAFLSVYFVC